MNFVHGGNVVTVGVDVGAAVLFDGRTVVGSAALHEEELGETHILRVGSNTPYDGHVVTKAAPSRQV